MNALSQSSSLLPPSPTPSTISSQDPSLQTSSNSKSSSTPIPLLPTELKREILRFCDPSTLAKTSSLSLAFLQLSSPLLYDKVDITGFDILAKLFCSRDVSHQPQLEPYLSLTNIHSLVVTPRSTDPPGLDPGFSRDRLPDGLVEVGLPGLRVPLLPVVNGYPTNHDAWNKLASLLNPRIVVLYGMKHPLLDDSLPHIDLGTARWTNLTGLGFSNCDGLNMNRWACLRGSRRELVIRPTFGAAGWRVQVQAYHGLTNAAFTRVKSVDACFSSLRLQKKVQRKLEEMWIANTYSKEALARRKGLINWEVVPELESEDEV